MIGEFVLVRTRNAGVHCGTLTEFLGTQIVLAGARRVWRWRGANSLHELSLHGPSEEWSRISEPVERIALTEAIEVIPCTPKAKKSLTRSRWGS
jgi:hypothetical protein